MYLVCLCVISFFVNTISRELIYSEARASIPGGSNKLWVSEYEIFLPGLAQQRWSPESQIWHRGSLGGENDAQMLNTHKAQRKRNMSGGT